MAINTQHPSYVTLLPDWTIMRDTYHGTSAVKAQGQRYLPPTGGMLADGMTPGAIGAQAYEAYRQRAQFFEFVSEAVRRMVGVLHRKPPSIEVPAGMEDIVESATSEDESIHQLLRRVNEAQLVYGRCGLFADLPAEASTEADVWLSLYTGLHILNWEEEELVVLDESGYVRQADFTWKHEDQYRVLRRNPLSRVYEQALSRGAGRAVPTDGEYQVPVLRGRSLERLPFVMVNTTDTTYATGQPPLLGLGHLSLAVYRGDADYRQHLHMMGQDTLVIIGARPSADGTQNTWRTGSGASIELDQGGDAKYIGIESAGLQEQRESLVNDKQLASNAAGTLIDTRSSQSESGESRKTRMVAQATTLTEIAQTGAAAIQEILRVVAKWRGLDPEKVVVQPNLEFGDENLTGQDMVQMMTARNLGFPISKKSLHGLAQDRGITVMDFEAEMEELAKEDQEDRARQDAGEAPRGVNNPPPEKDEQDNEDAE